MRRRKRWGDQRPRGQSPELVVRCLFRTTVSSDVRAAECQPLKVPREAVQVRTPTRTANSFHPPTSGWSTWHLTSTQISTWFFAVCDFFQFRHVYQATTSIPGTKNCSDVALDNAAAPVLLNYSGPQTIAFLGSTSYSAGLAVRCPKTEASLQALPSLFCESFSFKPWCSRWLSACLRHRPPDQ